jgi:HEAT repeat protein
MRRALLLATLALPLAAEDGELPHAQGVDVIKTVKAVKEAVAPKHGDKPWSDDIAALSSDDTTAQRRAAASLIRRGPPVLPDLGVLAKDQDWTLRARVAEVASGIGGTEAAPLLLDLSHDRDPRVREGATLGLGRCRGEGVFERLVEQLGANMPDERSAAANAMASIGDPRALEPLSRLDSETDDLAKRAMAQALTGVAAQARSVPELARLLPLTAGKQRDALLEACAPLGDPRLCPPLAALLDPVVPAYTRWLALRALAADGDSRAWEALCRTAAQAPEADLRAAASEAMRSLSGKSGSGEFWTLWWRDHADETPRTMERDRLLADLHDPDRAIAGDELARFTIDELAPLLDGALGHGSAWWPARAFAAMHADDPVRWTDALAKRARSTLDPVLRLALIIFIDQLDGPTALDALHAVDQDLRARMKAEDQQVAQGRIAPDHGAELVALQVAIERREKK